MVRGTAALPGKAVTAVVPGEQPKPADPALLQAGLQRYADDFAGRNNTALEDYARRANTPEAQFEALNLRLKLASSAMSIATGPNPAANLVDLVALATLTRGVVEERASQARPPGALDSWLKVSRAMETNAWQLSAGVLTGKQQREFRLAIQDWQAKNVGLGTAFFARPQDVVSAIRESRQQDSQPGSVFSLVGLDPTSGLDPAVREVTRTRLVAERALYATQRMPILLHWHIELLAEQFLRQEQVTNALAGTERLSRAAESASQTAALLPERLSLERKAIVDALETQEGRLWDLSAEVGRTLEAGEKMSASLNTTVTSFDGLMKRFRVGEPPRGPPRTNSPPFQILDYAHTAGEVASMAQQLDALIKDASGTLDTPALDKRMAELNALSRQARAEAQSVLNHAFLLAAGLVVLTFACALLYRRLLPRRPEA